ncbi:phenylalanine--tRNA ligase subunit beta [Sulfobacillus sp. hq2]|uniref:phenylalanine--tRNA ligase subunit beta n=1 Tax=Sulfobacillus TaxID=28033 RepID=UPI000CD0033B|nr:phenylalanine--tRNA ligase subunit beta [Sulfobacillus sp. hq2]POB09468.1 phenylalanine--tRNA ligase subunit beta [Sulfobacillus sp. hq2]
MKVSYRWLTRYVPDLPAPAKVADTLTQMGWEVAQMEAWGRWYEPVELVEVVQRVKHPDADHLSVVSVRRGDGSTIDIVTGASNGFVGDRVWYAPVGTELVDGRVLEAVRMRGILSPGMLLSAEELGFDQGPQDLWIWSGPEPLGTHFIDVIGGQDTVFELELTPNLAVFGQSMQAIARELAAALSLPLTEHSRGFEYGEDALARVLDLHDCPLYGLVAFQIQPDAPTPLWMQVLLRAIGQRVIFPAVDITNFLLWDIGQPLHAFDRDTVQGSITVRLAHPGERLETLDGEERTLGPEDLVIADDVGALALAGVMGGTRSAISSKTRHVLLEAAHFDSSRIFQTMRRHQIFSDAALHFGKGTDPLAVYTAPDRYRALLQEAGLFVATGPSQVVGRIAPARQIVFEPDKIRRLLGVDWADDKLRQGLERLGFGVTAAGDVVIPHARHDVSGSHDLAEEVARLYGLETIKPSVFLAPAVPGQKNSHEAYLEFLKNLLAEAGYWEVVTRSFTSPERLARAEMTVSDAVVVRNPLRDEERILRTSLLPGLLETVEANRARRGLALRLFEIAPVYQSHADGCQEIAELAVVQTLEGQPAYPHPEAPHVLDLKGVMEWVNVRADMGLTWRQVEEPPAYLHPGRTLALTNRNGTVCGYLGEVRPRIAQRYHAKRLAVWVMRLDLLPSSAAVSSQMHRPLRLPEAVRDLSLVVPANIAYQQIVDVVNALALPALRRMTPIDHYVGAFGESWTLRFVFQPDEVTLTEEDVDRAIQQILSSLDPYGVKIRQ